jgi:hypothetical protein
MNWLVLDYHMHDGVRTLHWLCLEPAQLQLRHKTMQVFGCKPIRNSGSFVLVISCPSVAILDS